MYLLAHVPAARMILGQVQDHLTAQGQRHPTVTVLGHDEPQAFDLWTGLHVIDHGTRQPYLTCILCPPGSGHHLRYEFRVTTLSGEVVGPVGSSCVFVRVLGEDAARRIGTDLAAQVRAHHARTQTLSQQALLTAAGNWREYLRRQGLDWVLTAMAGTTDLPKDVREALATLQARQKPLTLSLHKRLQTLTAERQARTASTSPDASRLPAVPAPSAFQPSTPALARPKATQGRRQAGAGNRMTTDDWEAYLRTHRLNVLVGHWQDIEPTLTLEDDTRAFLKETIQGRRPFRLDDLTLLQGLVRDGAMRAQLRTLGAPPRLLGRLPPLAPARRIDVETGLEVLNVRDDPQLREARAWNRGLQAVLPDEVWQRLQHAFGDGRLRADDYAAVCRTLDCRANPPLDPGLRTPERFLTLVALLLGQEMKFSRARMLLNPSRQAEVVGHLSREWHRYEAGQRVNDREIVARALQPTRAEAEAERVIRLRELARPPVTARLSGRAKRPGNATPAVTPSPAKIGAASISTTDRAARTAVPVPAPSVVLLQAQRTALQAAWGRGLSHLIPQTYRRLASRAVHQGTGSLTSEQVQVLVAALMVFEAKTLLEPPAFTVPGDEPRTPVRYAAALHRLFGELGVSFLQGALAQKGYGWLHTTFPAAYQAYVDTGTLHQGLDVLWIALL